MKNLVLIMATTLVVGCASMPYQPYAREVKKKPREGGVIALKTEHRPEDRQRADFLMAANCGADVLVNVQEEGEVAVGERTNSSASKTNSQRDEGFSLGGIKFVSGVKPSEDTATSSETVQLKEWQIAYNCVAVRAPAEDSKKKVSRK